jgi:hypothetical protein
MARGILTSQKNRNAISAPLHRIVRRLFMSRPVLLLAADYGP